MITPDEERYLATIPEDAMAVVQPYDPAVGQTTANQSLREYQRRKYEFYNEILKPC